jgi:hypothetical protein
MRAMNYLPQDRKSFALRTTLRISRENESAFDRQECDSHIVQRLRSAREKKALLPRLASL